MGVAQFYCCVGGHVSCIGAWGVGTPCALPFIRLDAILAHIPLECKRFFRTLHCPGRFFCCSEGVHCVSAAWMARHGHGRGAYRRLGARRGQRCVPLHAIPRRGTGGDLLPCPRGNCVALTPCGAWDIGVSCRGPSSKLVVKSACDTGKSVEYQVISSNRSNPAVAHK